MNSARISFRILPDTKRVAAQAARANGMSTSGMVRWFLARYVLAAPPGVRNLPTTRGAVPTSVFVGTELADRARAVAAQNGEDLSRPIVEFLTDVATQWATTHHYDTRNQ